jgi:hypothetical protein
MVIEVKRGGVTSPRWSGDGANVRVLPSREAERLSIRFDMPSKGGGYTDVAVRILPDSFEEIAKGMVVSDPIAAVRAFGKALAKAKLD